MNPHQIIVRAPNWVGDAVLAIPALRAIRSRAPDSRITLLARPWVAGLFGSAEFVDELWTHPAPGAWRWLETARQVRSGNFGLAILLTNSFESALTVFAGRVPERAGYRRDYRTLFLTRPVAVPEAKLHQSRYYLHLIDAVLGPGRTPEMSLSVSARGEETARQLLQAHGIGDAERLLVMAPGAAFGSAKRWHEDRFAALGDRLTAELGFRAAIIGSAPEADLGVRIRSEMKSPVALLAGQTDLETLMGVLARADLVVSNDSGPMHIAAALGSPTLGIFGSTDVEETSPLGARTRVVRHPVKCSPCLLRECPIDHPCMGDLMVEEVFEAGRSLARGLVSA